MFLTNHNYLNNLGRGSPSYIEIGPVVSDKKIFKLFYIDIEGRQVILKSVPWFLTRRFLNVSI